MATEIFKIPIDRFGRVVLPKPIRERMALAPGTEFEVEEHADAIVLKPISAQAKLVKKGPWLVVESEEALPPAAITETLRRVRHERDKKIRG